MLTVVASFTHKLVISYLVARWTGLSIFPYRPSTIQFLMCVARRSPYGVFTSPEIHRSYRSLSGAVVRSTPSLPEPKEHPSFLLPRHPHNWKMILILNLAYPYIVMVMRSTSRSLEFEHGQAPTQISYMMAPHQTKPACPDSKLKGFSTLGGYVYYSR